MVSEGFLDKVVRNKTKDIIISIRRCGKLDRSPHIRQIQEEADVSYAHTHAVVQELVEEGLARKETDGNKVRIELTDLGSDYADLLEDEIELFE